MDEWGRAEEVHHTKKQGQETFIRKEVGGKDGMPERRRRQYIQDDRREKDNEGIRSFMGNHNARGSNRRVTPKKESYRNCKIHPNQRGRLLEYPDGRERTLKVEKGIKIKPKKQKKNTLKEEENVWQVYTPEGGGGGGIL